MNDFEKIVDIIRMHCEKMKAKQYPLANSLLAQKDEYTKSLYIRMLCVLIQYANDTNEMQVIYLRRLIAGIDAEQSFQDYMKMALNITTGDVDEFINLLKDNDLRYFFCMDGIILLSIISSTDKQFELLAELMELLKINFKEVEYLSHLSKAIIEQNSQIITDEYCPKSLEKISFYHYLKDFFTGTIVNTNEMYHLYSHNKEVLSLTNSVCFTSENVIIENITADIVEDIVFDGCATVTIKKCTFSGHSSSFVFKRVGKVIVEECDINNFNNRFANFHSTNNIIIRKCNFLNCGCTSAGDIKGGVIYTGSDVVDNIILEGNKLNNCYVERVERRHNYWATAVFLYTERGANNMEVLGNIFNGCACRNNGDFKNAYISTNCIGTAIEKDNICNGSVKEIFELV